MLETVLTKIDTVSLVGLVVETEGQGEQSNYVFPLSGEVLKCVVYIYNNTPQRVLD